MTEQENIAYWSKFQINPDQINQGPVCHRCKNPTRKHTLHLAADNKEFLTFLECYTCVETSEEPSRIHDLEIYWKCHGVDPKQIEYGPSCQQCGNPTLVSTVQTPHSAVFCRADPKCTYISEITVEAVDGVARALICFACNLPFAYPGFPKISENYTVLR